MANKLYNKIIKYIKDNYKFFILVIFLFIILTVSLPYGVYTPGGTIKIEDRIDNKLYESKGSFNLTYVSYMNGKISNLLLALIIPNWDIVSIDNIKLKEETLDELNKRDAINYMESINNATYVAYMRAGKDIEVEEESDIITYIYEEAKTNLKVGDKILKINNQIINNYEDISKIINEFNYGDKINIMVKRDNKDVKCYAIINNIENKKAIGIAISKLFKYKLNPKIKYTHKSNESGPSGGLMVALSIYNSLIKEDITRCLKISGTGTIDMDGNIGSIGGVKYKLIGAVKDDCDIFIVPEENYEEALKVKKDNNYQIKLIKAITFDQVIESLKK